MGGIGNLDDVYITAAFGLGGYLFMRLDLDPAPLMLGLILGPMLEENFRRTLLLGCGSFLPFFARPISGSLLALIGIFITWNLVTFFAKTRRAAALA